MLSIEALLEPIGDAAESGEDLRYDPLFDSIREALTEDDEELPMGNWVRQAKRADYPAVLSLTREALQKRTKDLWLAAWFGEAAIQLEGYDGLEAALRLVTHLQERFWNSVHPAIDEGDVSVRAVAVEWGLNRYSVLIGKLPITESGLPYDAYRAIVAGVPWAEESTMLTSESLDALLKSTPIDFYVAVEGKLACSLKALDELHQLCDRQYGADGPSFAGMQGTLDGLYALITQQVRLRGPVKPERPVAPRVLPAPSPLPAEVERPDDLPAPLDPGDASTSEMVSEESQDVEHSSSEISDSLSEAIGRLVAGATYLIEEEPDNPACYLLAVACQHLQGNTGKPPSSDRRIALRQAVEAEEWQSVLVQSLRAILDGESMQWLDPHRYLWQAATNLGNDRTPAFVSAMADALSGGNNKWADELFDDDTPVANAETQRWWKQETTSRFDSAQHPPTHNSDDSVASARSLADRGDIEDAVRMLMESGTRANSGRGRFLYRLEIGRVCLQAGKADLATNMLRQLLTEAEERRLETWESDELLGEVAGMLLRSIDPDEDNAEERQKLHSLLCRTDPARAVALASNGNAN